MTEFQILFLKKFNYRLIYGINSDEISNIFSQPNRCNLICWALCLLDADYSSILEGNEDNINFLEYIITNNNLCAIKEVAGFFNGSMPTKRQFKILDKIFHFINEFKDANDEIEENRATVPEIENFITSEKAKTRKILPRKSKTLSEKDRNILLEKIQCETKENLEDDVNDIVTTLSRPCNLDFLKQFQQSVEILMKSRNNEKQSFSLDVDLKDPLNDCNLKLGAICEYITDLTLIKDIGNENVGELLEEGMAVSYIAMLAAEIINKIM